MRHPETWYHELARDLGHPGYVTLAEIRQQEAREASQVATAARWNHKQGSPIYWTEQDGATYTITREHGKRTWEIEVWPSTRTHLGHGRTQPGVGTLADAKRLALAMPCAQCGLASPMIGMTRRMPARPSLLHLVTERWRCTETQACEAERGRITGKGEGPRIELPAGLVLHNPVTGQSVPYVFDPADPAHGPVCRNSLVEHLGGTRGR